MLSNDSFAKYSWKVRNGVPVNVKGFDYTPELTKQDLIDRGIKVDGDKVYQWSNKIKDYVELDIKLMTTKPKYGKEISYKVVSYYKKEKHIMQPIALHRLIYVWYKGDIPKGMVVDHIDNNQLNNDLDNLQLLTRGENVKKNNNGHNQFTATKGTPKYNECIERLRQSMKGIHHAWSDEAKIRAIDRRLDRIKNQLNNLRDSSNYSCNHTEDFFIKKERNLRAKIEILQKEKISLIRHKNLLL